MKKATLVLGIILMAVLMAYPAFANIGQFVGNWKNLDQNTKGVTALNIEMKGNAVTVHAWGECHPQDCDWGIVPAYPYSPNVSANPMGAANAVSAIFKTGFSETILILHSTGIQLRADVFTRFTDNSNRSSYTASYVFGKAPQGLAAPVQLAPANGAVFNNYPRKTTLVWKPVPGAAKYAVEIDCMSCCQAGKWCTDAGTTWKVVQNINANQYTFDFVGAQPGRWRVWAIGPNNQPGPKSPWWEFRYTK
jgi:hypothetical protein